MEEIKNHETELTFNEIVQIDKADWEYDRSLIHIAVMQDDFDLVKQCVQLNADVNKIDYFAQTALFYCKSVEMAKYLIDNGADVNILNFRGETAIVSLYNGNNNEIIKYFAEITNLDLVGKVYSSTLLQQMIVNKERDLSLFKIVIPKTKNINRIYHESYAFAKINYYGSYLIYAVKNRKYMDEIMLLIESGINLYLRDKNGKNFYDLSSKCVQNEIERNYPDFMKRKDMTEQQRQVLDRSDKLKHLNAISNCED
jgi:ankyrin repeat protein